MHACAKTMMKPKTEAMQKTEKEILRVGRNIHLILVPHDRNVRLFPHSLLILAVATSIFIPHHHANFPSNAKWPSEAGHRQIN